MIDIAARVRAAGEPTRRKRPVCRVRCHGCGAELRSISDLYGVEYVKTKRGTEIFFHTKCMNDVWKHGIV
ncbi:MAG: hypothetical protein HFI66_11970 [Lachnospiraceae bacterium]|jgi:hypothetical protein|nr:hypothetical protein [Lachnospiraceae bacterium]